MDRKALTKTATPASTFEPTAVSTSEYNKWPSRIDWSPNGTWLIEPSCRQVGAVLQVDCYERATGRVVFERAENEIVWWSAPDELSFYKAEEPRLRIETRRVPDGSEVGAFEVKPSNKGFAGGHFVVPERGSGRHVLFKCTEKPSDHTVSRWFAVDLAERRAVWDGMPSDGSVLRDWYPVGFHPDGGSVVFFQNESARLVWVGFDGKVRGTIELRVTSYGQIRRYFHWVGPTQMFVFQSRPPRGTPRRMQAAIVDFASGTITEHGVDVAKYRREQFSPGGARLLAREEEYTSAHPKHQNDRWCVLDTRTFACVVLRPWRSEWTFALLDWCNDDTLVEVCHVGKGRYGFALRSAATGDVEAAGEWSGPQAPGRMEGVVSPCGRYYYLRVVGDHTFGAWFDLSTMPPTKGRV